MSSVLQDVLMTMARPICGARCSVRTLAALHQRWTDQSPCLASTMLPSLQLAAVMRSFKSTMELWPAMVLMSMACLAMALALHKRGHTQWTFQMCTLSRFAALIT